VRWDATYSPKNTTNVSCAHNTTPPPQPGEHKREGAVHAGGGAATAYNPLTNKCVEGLIRVASRLIAQELAVCFLQQEVSSSAVVAVV
jgi:hypothetical protein